MRAVLPLLLSGCMMAPPPPAAPAPVRDTDGVAAAIALQVIEAGNDARARHNVRALRYDDALNAAADDFVRELARRGVLTHQSQRAGYGTVMDRIGKAGGVVVRAGENVASMTVRNAMPVAVIEMWLNSPGHRRNLLDPGFTVTGAGAARGSGNVWYFVQVYGTPARGEPDAPHRFERRRTP